MTENSSEWRIDYFDEKGEEKIKASLSSDSRLEKKWPNFERDVTENPFFHPKPKRIAKLPESKTFPPGIYRYKSGPLRVVYYPEKKTKVVYPLEVASSSDVSYKKRSSR